MALHDTSLAILQKRAANFPANSPFALGLLGDSHIGQVNCPMNPTWYREILKKNVSKKVYAIIHGGDASDRGGTTLKSFVSITRNQLKYGKVTASKTPIFVNIGNHDYKKGKSVSRAGYTNNIGRHNSIIKLFDGGNGPRVAVVLLDTGYTISGQLPSGENYTNLLKDIEDKMITLVKNHQTIRFIIDMHVPPQITGDINFNKSHVLMTKYNAKFKKFIKDFTSKYPGRILAITAHHKHGWIQNKAYFFTYKTYDMKSHRIPVYVTAQGGHCDGNAGNAQYSFYILRFAQKTGVNHYSISSVSRYNVTYVAATNRYKVSKAIPIKKK